MGGGQPTVKCHVMITVLGSEEKWLLRTMGEGSGDSDCQPFLNSTKVCPLHYLQSMCFHPTLAIFFVVPSFCFFGEAPQNPDQEYHQFHYNTWVVVCSSALYILGNNLSIT